ncbi:Pam16-domain-containing protein [Mycotypha africana]|uniref:Pam16-domain-containing protein n=1 Tax=Mycotypha africana TaxID=64632 RepID=UPI00230138D0|nr:Pam16-domain-containing protein [Mycotypha africana]KAI8981982.1 Pam16-domain-containing protein [Mycotypha africana]
MTMPFLLRMKRSLVCYVWCAVLPTVVFAIDSQHPTTSSTLFNVIHARRYTMNAEPIPGNTTMGVRLIDENNNEAIFPLRPSSVDPLIHTLQTNGSLPPSSYYQYLILDEPQMAIIEAEPFLRSLRDHLPYEHYGRPISRMLSTSPAAAAAAENTAASFFFSSALPRVPWEQLPALVDDGPQADAKKGAHGENVTTNAPPRTLVHPVDEIPTLHLRAPVEKIQLLHDQVLEDNVSIFAHLTRITVDEVQSFDHIKLELSGQTSRLFKKLSYSIHLLENKPVQSSSSSFHHDNQNDPTGGGGEESHPHPHRQSTEEASESGLHGYTRFKLRSCATDPSYMREKLYYDMLEAADLPTAKGSYIRLYINEEPAGLYLMVDSYKNPFLQHALGQQALSPKKDKHGSGGHSPPAGVLIQGSMQENPMAVGKLRLGANLAYYGPNYKDYVEPSMNDTMAYKIQDYGHGHHPKKAMKGFIDFLGFINDGYATKVDKVGTLHRILKNKKDDDDDDDDDDDTMDKHKKKHKKKKHQHKKKHHKKDKRQERNEVEEWNKRFDVSGFLKHLAFEILLGQGDGYLRAAHNYLLYEDVLQGGRFIWLASDVDQTMGNTLKPVWAPDAHYDALKAPYGRSPLSASSMLFLQDIRQRPLIQRLFAIEEFQQQFYHILNLLRQTYFPSPLDNSTHANHGASPTLDYIHYWKMMLERDVYWDQQLEPYRQDNFIHKQDLYQDVVTQKVLQLPMGQDFMDRIRRQDIDFDTAISGPIPNHHHSIVALQDWFKENEWGLSARIIAQIVVSLGSVVTRAFVAAYKQAAANAAKGGGAAAASGGGGRAGTKEAVMDALTRKSGISMEEACQILNVTKEADLAKLTKSYEHLFNVNDPAKGGSFYLQSKVVRAKERFDMEKAQELKQKATEEAAAAATKAAENTNPPPPPPPPPPSASS